MIINTQDSIDIFLAACGGMPVEFFEMHERRYHTCRWSKTGMLVNAWCDESNIKFALKFDDGTADEYVFIDVIRADFGHNDTSCALTMIDRNQRVFMCHKVRK